MTDQKQKDNEETTAEKSERLTDSRLDKWETSCADLRKHFRAHARNLSDRQRQFVVKEIERECDATVKTVSDLSEQPAQRLRVTEIPGVSEEDWSKRSLEDYGT